MTARQMAIAALCLGLALIAGAEIYEANLPIDHPAIQYFQSPADDQVARLAKELETGRIQLDFRPDGTGYLASLLEHLGVNVDSQALVFSKTSFQSSRISPRNPRAVYFSDDVEVGYVPGGEGMELAALDPRQGVVFYRFDDQKPGRPRIERGEVCLKCHQGPATAGVPGIFIGSVFPGPSGLPDLHSGAIVTDHRTRFEERWGGWYVNGNHGDRRHRGNAVAPDPADPEALETDGTQNLANLYRKSVDTRKYLAPVSDIVALMTLEHQTQMVNLMTRLGWETRIAQHDAKRDDATRARFEALAGETVEYMLFAGEDRLQEPVRGVSTFTKTFPQRGPRDRKGRSLRDFDLTRRLFRYPLSYMVYSAAFEGLPDSARDRVYERLYAVLTGEDPSPKFAWLSNDDRRAIIEILKDTKPDLPSWWR